jgi:hypothetical protein
MGPIVERTEVEKENKKGTWLGYQVPYSVLVAGEGFEPSTFGL